MTSALQCDCGEAGIREAGHCVIVETRDMS